MAKAKKLKLDIKYANDDKIIKYNDIIRYIKNKNKNNRRIYPQEIYHIIQINKKEKTKKKDFRRAIKAYFIEDKTNRLKIRIRTNEGESKSYKEYYIAYQLEKK